MKHIFTLAFHNQELFCINQLNTKKNLLFLQALNYSRYPPNDFLPKVLNHNIASTFWTFCRIIQHGSGLFVYLFNLKARKDKTRHKKDKKVEKNTNSSAAFTFS